MRFILKNWFLVGFPKGRDVPWLPRDKENFVIPVSRYKDRRKNPGTGCQNPVQARPVARCQNSVPARGKILSLSRCPAGTRKSRPVGNPSFQCKFGFKTLKILKLEFIFSTHTILRDLLHTEQFVWLSKVSPHVRREFRNLKKKEIINIYFLNKKIELMKQ